MEKRGKIITYTVIHNTSEAFNDKIPYLIALVEYGEEERVLSFIEGYELGQKVNIGQEVAYLRNDETGNPVF